MFYGLLKMWASGSFSSRVAVSERVNQLPNFMDSSQRMASR